MTSKTIPFVSTKKKKKVDKDDPKTPIDEGTIGSYLKYSVYRRGVIHIFDTDLIFKKDCNVFEDLLKRLDLPNMLEGKEASIPGSGDNAELVFKKKKGEIELFLRERPLGIVNTLKKIISTAKRGK